MKTKTIFVLVNSSLKPYMCQTQQTVKKYITKDNSYRIFKFSNNEEAENFKKQLDAQPNENIYKQLQDEYYIKQVLSGYKEKLDLLDKRYYKTQDEEEEGVYIKLKKKRIYYVVDLEREYPKIFLNQTTVKKNNYNESQVTQFSDIDAMYVYLRELIQKAQKVQKETGIMEEQQGSDLPSLNIEQLDIKYKDLLSYYNITKGVKQNLISTVSNNWLQCTYYNTIHNHSSIGIALLNSQNENPIQKFGLYTGQKYMELPQYISILYGLRFCILNQIPNVVCQFDNELVYKYITNMIQPKQFRSQIYLNAINEYSQILKPKFELHDKQELQVAYQQATKAFQQHSIIKQRQKRQWKSNNND